MLSAVLAAVFAIAAGQDAASLLQSATRIERAAEANSAVVTFDWHEEPFSMLVNNNLGGYGPGNQNAPQEMRFQNVGVAHKPSGDALVDLVITSVDSYHWNARLKDNGRHMLNNNFTEFGRIFVKKHFANRFKMQLVDIATYNVVNVSAFDFVVLDLDQACSDASCYCDEEVVVWGASGYYAVSTAYSDFGATSANYDSGPSGVVACSDVTINSGFVADPTSVKTLSHAQARSSIVFHFENAGEFELAFAVAEHGPRALVFAGATNPLVWHTGVYHEHFDPVVADENAGSEVFHWRLDQEATVTANNLGGRGPGFDDPHEIRFTNVGTLYTPGETGRWTGTELDLVLFTEDQYWGSDFINKNWNGANGEYGEVGLSRRSEATMIFTFCEKGTYKPKVIPAFDFTIFDIDGMEDPTLGEEYTVFGATKYAMVDHAETLVDDSVPGQIQLTSHVTINNGAVPNPTSWANLTADQSAAAVQFRYYNTATWKVHFKISATTERAFLFGGQSRPPLTEIGTTKIIESAAPTPVPSSSPTSSPTPTPTAAPTSATITVYGDPHVMNIKGEAFDINRPSMHAFLIVPRGAKPSDAKLEVYGQVTPRGSACSGQLYLTNLTLWGEWLQGVKGLQLFTQGEDFNTPETIGLKVGNSSNLTVEEFAERLPPKMANVTAFNPSRPAALNTHVSLLIVRLYLGPLILKVSWEHQVEKLGYSNSLMLLTYGLGGMETDAGGLLGQDDHRWAASTPDDCLRERAGEQLLGQQLDRCRVRASAFLSREGAEE